MLEWSYWPPALLAANGVLILAVLLLSWRLGRLKKRIVVLEGLLEQRGQEVPCGEQSPESFAGKLEEVHLQRRLQEGLSQRNVPDKYRYIASLAERGLEPGRIAEAFQLSPDEAGQLVHLAQVVRSRTSGESQGAEKD